MQASVRSEYARGLGFVACVIMLGCSAEASSNIRHGTGSYTASGGSDGTSNAGAAGTSDLTGIGGGGAAGTGTAGAAGTGTAIIMTDGGMSCGASTQAATQIVTTKMVEVPVEVSEPLPVAIYVMLDNSSSMTTPVPPTVPPTAPMGATRWSVVVSGLTAFVNDPKSAGIDVALSIFPSSIGAVCDGTGYDTPVVPIGRLPGYASMITGALGSHSPNGMGTPTEGALRGLSKFCAAFQKQHPMEKCVAVLITDGMPGGCSMDSNALAGIAGSAKTNDNVLTYTIGMDGADFTLLDNIATMGGSHCQAAHAACNARDGQFQMSLEAIRDKVVTTTTKTVLQQVVQQVPIDCTWAVPAPTQGTPFDKNKVNVQFTANANGQATQFRRVASKTDCAALADAWYYDDPADPKQILVCPNTCDAVKASTTGKVDILLGCKTIVVQ